MAAQRENCATAAALIAFLFGCYLLRGGWGGNRSDTDCPFEPFYTPAPMCYVVAKYYPPGAPATASVSLNGRAVAFTHATAHGAPAVQLAASWAGDRFARSQQVGSMAGFEGGAWQGSLRVPQAALDQLAERNRSFPLEYDLDPKGNDDAAVPWLAPGRLLLHVK